MSSFPGNTQENYINKAKALFAPATHTALPIVVERGEGSYLFDIEGKRYIDFACGIAIAPVGHTHPRVVEAICEQAHSLVSSINIMWPRVKVDLAEKLVSILPGNIDSVFLCNSGTEAVEGALKLARKARPGRPNFLSFNGGFHGRSLGALTVTASKAAYRADYFPLVPNCGFVDYPYEKTLEEVLAQMESLFETNLPPESIAAIIVEPILGEGGYVVPPPEFLQRLRQICDRWDILLIFDEIQSGFGRTGAWFACEHFEVTPDIIVFAKGIASGMPLGGFAAKKELMSKMGPGSHGSTFGGNPISCAAALATIKVIEQEALIERVSFKGYRIMESLKQKFGEYIDVRGAGFMIGIEPKLEGLNVKGILNRALSKGLIALSCGPRSNAIRLMPALNAPDSVLHDGINILEQILDYEILMAAEGLNFKNKSDQISGNFSEPRVN
jgi:4-aminobutyrate aminotransferase